MLTVKWTSGPCEEIVPCEYVALQPSTEPNSCPIGTPGDFRELFAHGANEDGSGRRFSHGIIYVMNENGATVARYHLGSHEIIRADAMNAA